MTVLRKRTVTHIKSSEVTVRDPTLIPVLPSERGKGGGGDVPRVIPWSSVPLHG